MALVACAWLFGGCGPIDNEAEDNGGSDAGPSGPSIALVSVDVSTSKGVPAGAVDVVFHDGEGEVLSHVLTGSDGLASEEGEIGAVSIVDPAGVVTTFFAVEDGATIEHQLGGSSSFEPAGELITVYPSLDDGSVVQGSNGCNSDFGKPLNQGGDAINLAVATKCLSEANTVDIYATKADAGSELLTGYSFRKDIVHDGVSTTRSLPPWKSDFADATLTLSNAPENSQWVLLPLRFVRNKVVFNPRPFGNEQYTLNTGESRSRTLEYGQGFADSYLSSAEVFFGTGEFELSGYSKRVEHLAALPLSATVEGDQLLPEIYEVSSDVTNPQRPEVAWTSRASLADANAGAAFLSWSGGQWQGIFPSDYSAPVVMPSLPDALRQYRPSTQLEPAVVIFISSPVIDGPLVDVRQFSTAPAVGEYALTTIGGLHAPTAARNADDMACEHAISVVGRIRCNLQSTKPTVASR